MDQTVYWMLVLSINPDQKDNLKALVQDMTASVNANEPGTQNYEWHVNEDNSECHIYERYENSDALMTHLGNFKEHFAGRFFEILDIKSWVVYGDANDLVRETLGGMGAQFMDSVGGFTR